jgi:hypothetical protein
MNFLVGFATIVYTFTITVIKFALTISTIPQIISLSYLQLVSEHKTSVISALTSKSLLLISCLLLTRELVKRPMLSARLQRREALVLQLLLYALILTTTGRH